MIAAGARRRRARRRLRAAVTGRPRPLMRQDVRAIDWDAGRHRRRAAQDPRRRGASRGARRDRRRASSTCSARTTSEPCAGQPGEIIAQRNGRDLPRDRRRRGVDHAPSARRHADGSAPSSSRPRARWSSPASRSTPRRSRWRSHAPLPPDHTYREISYEERGEVGYLHFDFYNGAMSTDQCRPPARGLPRSARSRRTDEGDRADGRHRLLLQRHPPQRDRGRRRTRPRSRGAT